MKLIVLAILPIALLGQAVTVSDDMPVIDGATSMVVRGGGPGDQGATSLLPEMLPVWRGKDGSKWVWVKGEPHRISLPPPRVEWRDYAAYGGATLADYASSQKLLSHGGSEVIYRCSPPKPGCMSTGKFVGVSGASLLGMIFWDVWARPRATYRLHRAQAIGRKINVALRLGVAVANTAQ